MKELRWGRVSLRLWRNAIDGIAEVLPYVLVTAMWPCAWDRDWTFTLEVGWLRWSVGVTVEVRHG